MWVKGQDRMMMDGIMVCISWQAKVIPGCKFQIDDTGVVELTIWHNNDIWARYADGKWEVEPAGFGGRCRFAYLFAMRKIKEELNKDK